MPIQLAGLNGAGEQGDLLGGRARSLERAAATATATKAAQGQPHLLNPFFIWFSAI